MIRGARLSSRRSEPPFEQVNSGPVNYVISFNVIYSGTILLDLRSHV
jgi:hypothetical protein